MSAWTWTFIRIDKLTPDMVKTCIRHAISNAESSSYHEYSKMTFEDALKEWIEFHEEERDYLINDCKVSPDKLTPEYLEKELKAKLELHNKKMTWYYKCQSGEATIEEALKNANQLKDSYGVGDVYTIKRQGHFYIHIEKEIFRNSEYCDEEFYTVDSLIEHCKKCNGKQFIDFRDKAYQYQYWNDELEKYIREYYEAIGDDNFYVHFG